VSHPLALAVFPTAAAASTAARALHDIGIDREQLSVLARDHAASRDLADRMDATPGVELEDSPVATRFGELSGYMLAAIAVGLPGMGLIVAAGPLASELAEVAGHAAGSLASVLKRAGLPGERAEMLQREVANGAVLLGVHIVAPDPAVMTARVRDCLATAGATKLEIVNWASG
jgi:hypothetical protein